MRRCTQRKGFTLMELLLTLGIVVILGSVVIVSVINITAGLNMNKLDNIAKSIYLTGQSRLDKMKYTNELSVLYTDITESSTYVGQNLNIAFNSKDNTTGIEADKLQDYYYLFSSDALCEESLILLSDVISGGFFIVELSPSTGDIYSVFYSESEFSYDDITGLESRERSSRMAKKIGYYQAYPADDVLEPVDLSLNVQITNKEELYATITCAEITNMASDFSIEYVLADSSGKSSTGSISATDLIVDMIDGLSCELLLDSMEPNKSFSTLFNNLTPGDDLTLTVRVGASEPVVVTTNSLFETKTQQDNVETIQVNYLRHLNNLRSQVYVPDDAVTSVIVNQGKDIDFSSANWNEGDEISLSTKSKKVSQSNAYVKTDWNPLESFQPLEISETLSEGESVLGFTFNGVENLLENFLIQDTETNLNKPVGLFSRLTKATLSDIRLVNPKVESECSFVGTLVGDLNEGSSVKGCGAYLSATDRDGQLYLVANQRGKQSVEFQLSKRVEKKADVSVETGNNEFVGGLIGSAKGSSIEESFGAVYVLAENAEYVGGLIGKAECCNVTKCYSSCTVKGKSTVGGLVGSFSIAATSVENGFKFSINDYEISWDNLIILCTGSVTIVKEIQVDHQISDCYSTSDVSVTNSGVGGGLVGKLICTSDAINIFGTVKWPKFSMNTLKVNCNLTLKCVIDSVAYGTVVSSGIRGPFVGDVVDDNVTVTTSIDDSNIFNYIYVKDLRLTMCDNCSYLKSVSEEYMYSPTSDLSGVKAKEFDILTENVNNEFEDASPYSTLLGIFPFKMITIQKTLDENEKIHHYGDWPVVVQTKPFLSLVYYERYSDGSYGFHSNLSDTTLRTDASVCVEDGYALVSNVYISSFLYWLNLDSSSKVSDPVQLTNIAASRLGIASDSMLIVYRLPIALQFTSRSAKGSDYFYDKLTIRTDFLADTDKFTFYYCPHFAKTAHAPLYGSTDVAKPSFPATVSVRSARQLNALGRYHYFWNDANLGNRVTFEQECDIDFSTYTKNYCGGTYGFMSTTQDNPYRNRPIGYSGSRNWQKNDNGFYRVDDSNESYFNCIYDGKCNHIIGYCLDCLDSYDCQFVGLFGEMQDGGIIKNVVMHPAERSTAYIKSGYDKIGYRAAVGGLLGLGFRTGNDFNTSPLVENCAIYDYDISYYKDEKNIAQARAVGGLVGFSFGRVYNCSAVCNSVKAEVHNNGGEKIAIGGLCGVNAGFVNSCYSGGTLGIKGSGSTDASYSSIGGIAGDAFLVTYGGQGARLNQNENQGINNCYSYCLPVSLSDNTLQYSYYGIGSENAITADYLKTGDVFTPKCSNCYFWSRQESPTAIEVIGVTECTNKDDLINTTNNFKSPFGEVTNPADYPFKGVVTDGKGKIVHYGSYPKS